jgi:predicted RNA-binding protein with PIN domain
MTDWLEILDDGLTATLADAAGEVLRALSAEAVPASLRPLLGFDRRKLASSTARRQLLRALTRDSSFRGAVDQALRLDDAVAAVVDGFTPRAALELVVAAAERSDLPLLVAALWVHQPDGWEYGLGCAAGLDRGDAARRAVTADADALARRVDEQEAARRRADELRAVADAHAAKLTAELRDARGERRDRDQAAVERERAAVRRADEAERSVERERTRVGELEQQLQREVERATRLAQARDRSDARADATAGVSIDEVASAARQATHLADRLRSLEAAARRADDAPRRAGASQSHASERGAPRAGAPARRTRPSLPGGMVADSASGAIAMLRPETLLVVDGYNISHRGWPDASIADQRERLARALHQLARRSGCTVVCCFDGEGQSAPALRRDGLRVVFSDAGEEADELVVRTVEETPKRTPVVVASSDAWVREHAEAAGAVVISAATMLGALQTADRRP